MDIETKTPLPNAIELGSIVSVGNSFITEMIRESCSCGRPIGLMSYSFSEYLSKEGNTYSNFAKEQNLNMCCRSRFLSPSVVNIVSADIGARVIIHEREKDDSINPENIIVENSPSPTYNVENIVSSPPPISYLINV